MNIISCEYCNIEEDYKYYKEEHYVTLNGVVNYSELAPTNLNHAHERISEFIYANTGIDMRNVNAIEKRKLFREHFKVVNEETGITYLTCICSHKEPHTLNSYVIESIRTGFIFRIGSKCYANLTCLPSRKENSQIYEEHNNWVKKYQESWNCKNCHQIIKQRSDKRHGFCNLKCQKQYEKEEEEKERTRILAEKNKYLGQYKGNKLYLRDGPYGYYLEYGGVRKSLKFVKINIPFKNISYDDAISILENSESADNSFVRKLDNNLSIRKGKYGDYIFYKTEKMRKPLFFKLNGFNDDYKNCSLTNIRSWIKEKYEV